MSLCLPNSKPHLCCEPELLPLVSGVALAQGEFPYPSPPSKSQAETSPRYGARGSLQGQAYPRHTFVVYFTQQFPSTQRGEANGWAGAGGREPLSEVVKPLLRASLGQGIGALLRQAWKQP